MKKKKITVADAIEAMRQNNIPMHVGGLKHFAGKDIGPYPVIDSACALGQCGINLGATPESVQSALSHIRVNVAGMSPNPVGVDSWIISQNDSYRISPDKVANQLEQMLTPEQLATEIEVQTEFTIVKLKGS